MIKDSRSWRFGPPWKENIVAHRGVYVAVTGPEPGDSRSTDSSEGSGPMWWVCPRSPRSWWRFTPGMRVLGFSIITDLCLPDALAPVSLEEIIAVAQEAEGKLRTIVRRVLQQLNPNAGCRRDGIELDRVGSHEARSTDS